MHNMFISHSMVVSVVALSCEKGYGILRRTSSGHDQDTPGDVLTSWCNSCVDSLLLDSETT